MLSSEFYSSLMSSQISKSRLKSQTYKVQKYCNTNLLDFNFLIIKDLLRSKKVFSNSIKISEFKKFITRDIFSETKSYLFSNNLMPVLRC